MLAFFSNAAAKVRRDEKGATAVEYGIMVALIAVVIIVAVTLLGGSLNDMFLQVQCQISGGDFAPAVAASGTGDTAVEAAAAACTPAAP
jgi:pilus assembly protein Flp/PilA